MHAAVSDHVSRFVGTTKFANFYLYRRVHIWNKQGIK